ncbi:FUT7-like protein [Mya arenaria]|uniref:FUT7-like protein n=1 Tax=Mya arenaria TaxID=6604 RepID=A0ABY7E4E9_MYAAR|nr:FUT7-like protein [Mya arenaria]
MISDEIQLQCTVTRKKLVKICMAVVVLATIRLAVLLIETRQEIHTLSTHTRNVVDRPNRTESGHRILLWIRYKSDFKIEKQRMCMQKCPVQCTLTDDKNATADASAIVFVLTSVWAENWELGTKKLVDLPVRRDADQVWVLSNLEPPANMFGDLAALNGIFNWTMWYRSDADIHLPYSEPRRLTTEEAIRNIEKMKTRNIFSEKTKEITGKAEGIE